MIVFALYGELDVHQALHLKLAGETDCAPEPLPTLRHSTAHLMAQAVTQMFPEVKVAIGPAIEDGFYYDFAKPAPFTPEESLRVATAHITARRSRTRERRSRHWRSSSIRSTWRSSTWTRPPPRAWATSR